MATGVTQMLPHVTTLPAGQAAAPQAGLFWAGTHACSTSAMCSSGSGELHAVIAKAATAAIITSANRIPTAPVSGRARGGGELHCLTISWQTRMTSNGSLRA